MSFDGSEMEPHIFSSASRCCTPVRGKEGRVEEKVGGGEEEDKLPSTGLRHPSSLAEVCRIARLGGVSLAGAATSIIFVATKVLWRPNTSFVATKVRLS